MTSRMPTAPPMPSAKSGTSLSQLQSILNKYEITIADANDLVVLQDYEIVFIADDSGSMQLCSVPVNERRLGAAMPTRWDELCQTIRVVAELACCFDADGIDMHFLNRQSVCNITHIDDPRLAAALAAPPSGGTPLTSKVQEVMAGLRGTEKPVLILIATDGEPNGGASQFKSVLRRAVQQEGCGVTKFRFQILACTEDDTQVEWLNDFDDSTDGVDVTDDYYSERREVLAAGNVTEFRRSDWVIKALLGPICSKYDKLDQRRPVPSFHVQGRGAHKDGCCLVM
eukprot:TRINITY_DN5581_c0_g1_i1.p1 TRINITY_DN5581_c0_g1~~TRINITY_DN5581_c0_g1_i1.p1  ORF type:complete len:284 (+),score=111.24 TRINITY_DN5581_c0_g1_i1:105-956(+)